MKRITPGFAVRNFLFLILTLFNPLFYSCISDCTVECPSRCVPVSFVLLLNGANILEIDPAPFPIDSIHIKNTPLDPESPPLLGVDNNSFKMVVCQNVEYELFLEDNRSIEITAEIDTFAMNSCCVFFAAKSIHFNGFDLYTTGDPCRGGEFELN